MTSKTLIGRATDYQIEREGEGFAVRWIVNGRIVHTTSGFDTYPLAYDAVCKRMRLNAKNAQRRAIHDAYTSCGMTRVRGNLGGTYYE